VIALIGPPGSGKSTVGAALAARLGLTFTDLEEAVAARWGDVGEMVLSEGAAVLAARQADVLADLDSGVVAVGSGAFADPRTATLLARAVVVFLDADASLTFARSGMNRPQPAAVVNPRQLWTRMLRERQPTYRAAADLVVEVGDRDVPELVAAIVGALPPVR